MSKKSKNKAAVTAETIVNGITSDANFKAQCTQFFALAMNRAYTAERRPRQGAGLFIMNSVIYDADDELLNAAKTLVIASVSKLGPKFGNADELNTLIWSQNKQGLMTDAAPADVAKDYIEALTELTRSEYTYVCGNHLFVIVSRSTRRVKIGPLVEIVANGDTYLADVFDEKIGPGLDITVGGDYVRHGKSPKELSIPPTCWKVSVDAAQAHLKEEAEWLIDVAVSLMRLSQFDALQTASHGFFLRQGKVEPMPCVRQDLESRHLFMTEEDIFAGAMTMPPSYHLDDTVIAGLHSPEFVATAEAVFRPPPGSLAERLGHGLGWLTRGRQSEDRAQRILFCFTALEALLTSDDKTAPVVQNIARSAAVILSNDVTGRAEVAKNIRDLYAFRSGVVHGGKRGVTGVSVNTAQMLIESIYIRVLRCVPLTQTFQKFQDDLGRATYGLPWPANDEAKIPGAEVAALATGAGGSDQEQP